MILGSEFEYFFDEKLKRLATTMDVRDGDVAHVELRERDVTGCHRLIYRQSCVFKLRDTERRADCFSRWRSFFILLV